MPPNCMLIGEVVKMASFISILIIIKIFFYKAESRSLHIGRSPQSILSDSGNNSVRVPEGGMHEAKTGKELWIY